MKLAKKYHVVTIKSLVQVFVEVHLRIIIRISFQKIRQYGYDARGTATKIKMCQTTSHLLI